MASNVNSVMHREVKIFLQRMRGNAVVGKTMRASAEAEEAIAQQRRLEFKEMCSQKRAKAEAHKELLQVEAKLKKARKEVREAEAVVAAREAMKSFSIVMLGLDKKTEAERHIRRDAK